jgi:hypothetical protein
VNVDNVSGIVNEVIKSVMWPVCDLDRSPDLFLDLPRIAIGRNCFVLDFDRTRDLDRNLASETDLDRIDLDGRSPGSFSDFDGALLEGRRPRLLA